MIFCAHRNIGVHSVKGLVECPDCFRLVRHPWAPEPRVIQEVWTAETGIERMEKLNQEADRLRGRGMGVRL